MRRVIRRDWGENVTVGQLVNDTASGKQWWQPLVSVGASAPPLLPVGIFVWGLTEDDVRLAEFQAHDEAAWRGWAVQQTTRVIGGRVSDAHGRLPGRLLAKRATYGRVAEVYELTDET